MKGELVGVEQGVSTTAQHKQSEEPCKQLAWAFQHLQLWFVGCRLEQSGWLRHVGCGLLMLQQLGVPSALA